MGKINKKAASQAVKESRNNVHEKEKKKDFSNWIKALKPKVYITDSSSFKRLVQDLTGNGSSSTVITNSEPEERRFEKVPIMDIYEVDRGQPESSVEASIDATTADSSEFCNPVFVDQDFNYNQVCNGVSNLEDISLGNVNSEANQQVDLLAYWDLESWLLDSSDHPPCTSFYNACAQVGQDVSIYDYELSGFL